MKKRVLGVVGGAGPLASAEFIKTIYECSLGEREQEAPAVLLYSDPTFPDRTEALLAGDSEPTLTKLVAALEWLRDSGASQTVICCVTMHHLLKRVPDHLRAQVISLVDVIIDAVARSRERHVLVCSIGTRRLEIFQSHERWHEIEDYIAWPDETDQQFIHQELIYQVKQNRSLDELLPPFVRLVAKYKTRSFVAGCTEIHLLAKRLSSSSLWSERIVDPLLLVAEEVARETLVCQ
jgi:aspartate racemase